MRYVGQDKDKQSIATLADIDAAVKGISGGSSESNSAPEIDGNIVVGKCMSIKSRKNVWYFCDRGTGVLLKGMTNVGNYDFLVNNEVVEASRHAYNEQDGYIIWRVDSPKELSKTPCVFRLLEYSEARGLWTIECKPLCKTKEYRTCCGDVYIENGKIVNRRMMKVEELGKDPYNSRFNYSTDIKQYVRVKVCRDTRYENYIWKFVRTHQRNKFKFVYMVSSVAKRRWKSLHSIIVSRYKMKQV